MPPVSPNDHEEMLRLLRENNALAKDNNKILHRLYRYSIAGFVFKCIWFAIIIGLPFAIYYYLLAPYFGAFGTNYETMSASMPWLNTWEEFFPFFAN